MPFTSDVDLAFAALAIEATLGYPDSVYRLVRHPVTWIGALLSLLERVFNRPQWPERVRRCFGAASLAVSLLFWGGLAVSAESFAGDGPIGFICLAVLASSLPAQRSLHRHVADVAQALESQGLEAARAAVGHIVGRDVAALDEQGVARAAIESLAENFSDGVVAPAFWTAVGGLPGGLLYKVANTADSMIGHKTPRWAAFGWAAARFDDLVNLPASRLSALWLLAAAALRREDVGGALGAIRRDATRHRSPNAGWPEAAMAGALGLKLAGPRVYAGVRVDDAYMGEGRRQAGAADVRRALALYRLACGLQMLALCALALIAQE